MGAAIQGVVIDASLLFKEDHSGNLCCPPKSSALLRRLQFSQLRVGICCVEDASPQKARYLAETVASYSFDYISTSASQLRDSLDELFKSWHCVDGACCYVTLRNGENFLSEFNNLPCNIICVCPDVDKPQIKNKFCIKDLDELLITICSSSKMASKNDSALIIGYVMKSSREEDFAKRGAFPMYPTQNGLMFVPLSFDIPLDSQLQKVDAVLHKATDEISGIDLSSAFEFPMGISFSKGINDLERYSESHPDFYMIDPLNNIYPLLDRHKIQHILLELESLNIGTRNNLRAPRCLQVDNFGNPKLREQFIEAKLSLPVIVKPQVACGVANAHNMALVFKYEDFENLNVPLPAIIQEYVDHGSSLFKFYVIGDKVFHAVKKSMPNASNLLPKDEKSGSNAVLFNSLKSLPVSKEHGSTESLDVELVNDAANWLKTRLGLTIFGFDVVIQEGSRDHVIVDLNYLPSFKEVPDSDAIPAFWVAIKGSYESMKENKARKA